MNELPKINVKFPIVGKKLPADHGYFLYPAISQTMPQLHQKGWLGIELIRGVPFDKGIISLPNHGASLNLRLPADKFSLVIPLAGKQLDIQDYKIRLGIPSAHPLQPSQNLYSKIVSFIGLTQLSRNLIKIKNESAEGNRRRLHYLYHRHAARRHRDRS